MLDVSKFIPNILHEIVLKIYFAGGLFPEILDLHKKLHEIYITLEKEIVTHYSILAWRIYKVLNLSKD